MIEITIYSLLNILTSLSKIKTNDKNSIKNEHKASKSVYLL